MAPGKNRFVAMHNRGVITDRELASRIVETTTERLSANFVASLPAIVVDLIRENAAASPDTQWVQIRSCCTSDLEAWEASRREQMARWLAGLALWREYFGFNAEEQA